MKSLEEALKKGFEDELQKISHFEKEAIAKALANFMKTRSARRSIRVGTLLDKARSLHKELK